MKVVLEYNKNMEINNLEKSNELQQNLENDNKQNNFLGSMLGKVVNTAIDIGIRALLPDFLEDQIIELKDNLFNHGFKDGIKKTIDDTISSGKAAIGVITGNFDTIPQIQDALRAGNFIEGVSSVIDFAVNKATQAGIVNYNVGSIIKSGKNAILNNVENNLEKSFQEQYNSLDNINEAMNKWKSAYEKHDFSTMEKQYNLINKQMKNLVPLENTINQARTIENLHNLIKNNGQNFDLSKEEIELAKKLI